jgi:hypothetical protein
MLYQKLHKFSIVMSLISFVIYTTVAAGIVYNQKNVFIDHYAIVTDSYHITVQLSLFNSTATFSGGMSPNSMQILTNIIEQHNISTLYIQSQGGSMDESYVLSDFLSQHPKSLQIIVDDYCISACAFGIMHHDNVTLNNALVAFHTPYMDPEYARQIGPAMVMIQTFVFMTKLQTYLSEKGYNDAFFQHMQEHTSPNVYIVFFNISDLHQYRNSEPPETQLFTIMSTEQIIDHIVKSKINVVVPVLETWQIPVSP